MFSVGRPGGEGAELKNRSYVQEKVYVALLSLAEGDGDFTSRLECATISSLMRLDHGDLDDELDEQLSFILSLTRDNIQGGHLVRSLDDGERRRLVEALLSLTEALAGF